MHPHQSGLLAKTTDSSDRVIWHTITHLLDTSKSTNSQTQSIALPIGQVV
jgi:hypothetical protein